MRRRTFRPKRFKRSFKRKFKVRRRGSVRSPRIGYRW